MKMRLRANSIRLRLQRDEVKQLYDTGLVEEILQTGEALGGDFRYLLETKESNEPSLRVEPRLLNIRIPATWAKEMHTSAKVGYTATISTPEEVCIKLVVEKDFKCLVERPGEDESNAYANPDACNQKHASRATPEVL